MANISTDFSELEKLGKSLGGTDQVEFAVPVIVPPFAFGVGLDVRQTDLPFNFATIAEGCKTAIARAMAEALPRYLDSSIQSNDLIESGELKNSLSVALTPSGLEIRYSAPYAALMHEGGYITPYGNRNAGKVFIPGRPWIDEAIAKMPVKVIAEQACVNYLASIGLR